MPTNAKHIYSVSDLNRLIQQTLRKNLPLLWLEGEISNFSRPKSGHWYYTLKDKETQIRCVMFQSHNQYLDFIPEDGQQVRMRGSISFYETRGDCQFISEHMELSGYGELQRQFEALVRKLKREGLFDMGKKLPLPLYPRGLGVITSPTGAVLHDVLGILKQRCPMLPVIVYSTPVQGEEAAAKIAAAIARADANKDCEVLLITRGGGSLEDLWPFNEEIVARAIQQAKKPLVSAIGHETDVTISDYCADLRASTPSTAASLIAPNQADLRDFFSSSAAQLFKILMHRIHYLQYKQQHSLQRLYVQRPEQQLQRLQQQIDEQGNRLVSAQHQKIRAYKTQLDYLIQRLYSNNPEHRIKQYSYQVEALKARLQRCWYQHYKTNQHDCLRLSQTLSAYNPLHVLNRGYAIVHNRNHQIIRKAEEVDSGDILQLRLAHGEIDVTVN